MTIGLVSEMVRRVVFLSRGFMSAFFQKAVKVEVAKEQLHMEVSIGATVEDTNFSICCDMAS